MSISLKKNIILSISVLIILIGIFILVNNYLTAGAGCQENHNVRGWAWSDNLGWVSFSCRNQFLVGQGHNFGVNIDGLRRMSGYAWSDTVGWISFNEADLAGCPETDPANCRAALSHYEFSGWAKVIHGSGIEDDEWISLRGNVSPPGSGSYGVWLRGNDFQGWAWGDRNVSWLSFRGPNYGVWITQIPPPLGPNNCVGGNVGGWAWSDGIGWVSLSCENHPQVRPDINYGVNIGADGTLSGHAWSQTVGWISFNQAQLTGCPDTNQANCRAFLQNNELNGWARVMIKDGSWISLRGEIPGTGGATYRVQFDRWRNVFHGWAWGDRVIGWLNFDGATFDPGPAPPSDPCGTVGRNVWGWAWSDGIGWVSFSCGNHPGTIPNIDYGVHINTDRTLSGHAWSQTVGWISFNRDHLNVPECPYRRTNPQADCRAVLGENNELSGWARVMARNPKNDKWISLRGIILPPGSGPYGVWLWRNEPFNRNEFRGFAWGDENIGWLSWNCATERGCTAERDYRVETSFLGGPGPEARNPRHHINYCTDNTPQVQTRTTVTLIWDFHPGGRTQRQYKIEISENANFTSIIHSPTVTGSAPTHSLNHELAWGMTYYWRVSVADEGHNWSPWSETRQFTMRDHESPRVNFTNTPERVTPGADVTFNGSAETFGGSFPSTWAWTFERGTPSVTENSSTTTARFALPAPWNATLRVTDSSGYDCPLTRSLDGATGLMPPLPDWREIIPFGELRLFLSDISERVRSLISPPLT